MMESHFAFFFCFAWPIIILFHLADGLVPAAKTPTDVHHDDGKVPYLMQHGHGHGHGHGHETSTWNDTSLQLRKLQKKYIVVNSSGRDSSYGLRGNYTAEI